MRLFAAVAAALVLLPFSSSAQDKTLDVVHRIKTEAFDNSQVMDTLESLTDLYGPRLTGSPEFDQAADWAIGRLKGYGIGNVHKDDWGPFGRQWSPQSFTLDMLTPRYSHLVAAPLAWSAPTTGPETGDVFYAPIHISHFWDLKTNREVFEKYKAEWHGKLKGKIVLISEAKRPEPSTKPLFERYTDAQLAEIEHAPTPALRRNVPVDQLKFPEDPKEAREYLSSLPPSTVDALYDKYIAFRSEIGRFFHDEGVVGLIRTDDRSHNGLIFAESAGSVKAKDPLAPPTFVIPVEQYSRMTRLLDKKQSVSVRMDLKAKVSDKDVDGYDIVGEIPGQKKPDEIVMIGAHFDSWHTATGATDNGAGSAVMIEVMRILKTLNLPLDRTVRIGLWSGEEQGLFGSEGYVRKHLADPKTMKLQPEYAKFDCYLNLDNGSGKIRGIYLENDDAARPLFAKWMQPFRDLGVTTTTLQHTEGTDHESFDAVYLPAFQFIQDPLDYFSVTHHSDMDTYTHAVPADLMQASAVIATLVYDIANNDEFVPRKPAPAR